MAPRPKFDILLTILSLVAIAAAQTSEDCRIPADPDISGLGVRLGLYFQLPSNIVLSVARPDEARDSLLPTELFFTGFLIAVVCSVAGGDYAPGAQISCTWYPVVLWAVMSLDWTGFKDNVGTRAAAASALILASLCLNVWFWWKDLFEFKPDQCMAPRVFFFYNFSAYGGIRYLFRTFTLSSLIAQVTTFPGINLHRRLKALRHRLKQRELEHGVPPSSKSVHSVEPSNSPTESNDDNVKSRLPATPSSSTQSERKSLRQVITSKSRCRTIPVIRLFNLQAPECSGRLGSLSNTSRSWHRPSKVIQEKVASAVAFRVARVSLVVRLCCSIGALAELESFNPPEFG